MIRAVTLAGLLAGCLGEPARPHGDGPPIAHGSVIRHRTAVADLNGDGYDDLAIWGNEGTPGANPTLFVYFGGETLENPDARADLTIVDQGEIAAGRRPVWYEAFIGSPYVSADGRERGLALATAQDTTTRTASPTRLIYPAYVPVTGRTLGVLQPGPAITRGDGGYAPDDPSMFVVQRDTVSSLPARQLLYGDENAHACPSPLAAASRLSDVHFELTSPGLPGYVSNAFTLPPTGESQDLLLVGTYKISRTMGDPVADNPNDSFLTMHSRDILMLPTNDSVYARGRQEGSHFYASVSNVRDEVITVVDVDGASDPTAVHFRATGRVDDTAVAQLGGDDRIDVAVFQNGTLGVYLDIAPGSASIPEIPTPTNFGSRDALPGYDLLAVGNFHGDARREIYAINSADPAQGILCYRVVGGDSLERCDGE